MTDEDLEIYVFISAKVCDQIKRLQAEVS